MAFKVSKFVGFFAGCVCVCGRGGEGRFDGFVLRKLWG